MYVSAVVVIDCLEHLGQPSLGPVGVAVQVGEGSGEERKRRIVTAAVLAVEGRDALGTGQRIGVPDVAPWNRSSATWPASLIAARWRSDRATDLTRRPSGSVTYAGPSVMYVPPSSKLLTNANMSRAPARFAAHSWAAS